MRTTTRARRAAPARRGAARLRLNHARRGSVHGRRPTRRGRVPRRPATWRVLGVAVLVVLIGLAAFLFGAFKEPVQVLDVAHQLVYTAPTANDAAISLPASVKADLRQLGLRHQQIALTRIDSSGDVATTTVDLTPRVDDSPESPALKVEDRAIPIIDTKIAAIEAVINSARATTGSRALFAGLSKITFTSAPITIISSGLDLVNPINFRDLTWSVPAQKVVSTVKAAGELPSLHGPVTFVVVPEAGSQSQLREAQKAYRNDVWRAVLTDSGATSVTFVDANGTNTSSGIPAPPVALPDLPSTPIQQIKNTVDPRKTTCTLPATYFVVNEASLIDPARTVADLSPCVASAVMADATFELDGWTSYEGPLDADGKPAIDSPDNRRLSTSRVQTIADLLVNDLAVPASRIVGRHAHGNVDQPVPDPRSPANRRVDITYTVK